MAKTTAADMLVDRLIDWGVDTIFGLPGDGINGIFEALRTRQDKIKFIQVRHEEAAALAACGYAKFTNRLGVCLATSGPGGIHLLNGLYDAKCDGQPVLAITGHTFHDLIGTHYQQDIDLDKLFMDVAAFSQRVMGPTHVENVVDEAIRTALGQRAVAHINIPKDMQDLEVTAKASSKANIAGHSGNLSPAAIPLPPDAQLQEAADLLTAGKKVVILAGRGCLDAREEILELADRLAAPIVKPLLGKAVVPDNSPYTTGGLGLLGTAPSQDVMQDCDTLLMAGTSFPYLEFYPKAGTAKCIQIDSVGSRIGLRYPIDVGLVGDCRRVLGALLEKTQRKEDRTFLTAAQEATQKWNELLVSRAEVTDLPLKSATVAFHLNQMLADDAIVTADCGTVTTYAARYLQMRGDMMFSSSGMLATMGNGLPYSIAAAIAYPGRQIVCFSGDGGFTMMMSELLTIVKYKLPIKIVILKNNVLGMIKWEQMAFEGNPQFGVELQPLDFAKFAQACGASGFSVSEPDRVHDVLREAFACDGPAVVEAVVDPHEPMMPGNVTMDQALKFGQALLRGQKDAWKILKNVIKQQVREVI
jgi:pyruvate dehydrogenase (quinone)